MLVAVGIGGIVIVRSHCLGDSPIRHGEFRIEFRSVLERSGRFVVVEGINETQSLVEKFLRFQIMRGYRVVQVAKTGDERNGMTLRVVGMILRRPGHTEQKTAQ